MDKIQKNRITTYFDCQNITLISPSLRHKRFTCHTQHRTNTLPLAVTIPNGCMEDYRYETVSLALELGLQLSTNPFYVRSLAPCRPEPKTQRPFHPARRLFFTASHSHSTTGRENGVILPKARKYYLCNSLQHQTYQESR